MKVAKLVSCSLMTRVIVDENATKDDIIRTSKHRFVNIVNESLGDNIETIEDDEECPYEEGEEYNIYWYPPWYQYLIYFVDKGYNDSQPFVIKNK